LIFYFLRFLSVMIHPVYMVCPCSSSDFDLSYQIQHLEPHKCCEYLHCEFYLAVFYPPVMYFFLISIVIDVNDNFRYFFNGIGHTSLTQVLYILILLFGFMYVLIVLQIMSYRLYSRTSWLLILSVFALLLPNFLLVLASKYLKIMIWSIFLLYIASLQCFNYLAITSDWVF